MGGGSHAVTLTQTPAPTGDNFDASVSVGGGCVENYELIGMFTDATHFTAMLILTTTDMDGSCATAALLTGDDTCTAGITTSVTGTRTGP